MKTTRQPATGEFSTGYRNGFTLVELFVVVALVAILAAVLLPAAAGTKPDPRTFQCLNNEKQITLGWQMYAADNNSLLPPNDYPYNTAYFSQTAAVQATLKNWVVGTMIQAVDAADVPGLNQGKSELLDPNTLLSPYVRNRAVYHCPADNFINPLSQKPNVRSYSMNSAVGTVWNSSSQYQGASAPPIGSPVGGGWLDGAIYNASQTKWRTYGKMSSFAKPGPANTYVLMDEAPLSINDGTLDTSANAAAGQTYLIDNPSGNHGQAAGIAFVDGHVLIKRWLDNRTFTPVPRAFGGPPYNQHTLPDNPDCFYLASITSAPR